MGKLDWLRGQETMTDEEIQTQHVAELRHGIEYAMNVQRRRDAFYKLNKFPKNTHNYRIGQLAKALADTTHNKAKSALSPVAYVAYQEYMARLHKRRILKNANS